MTRFDIENEKQFIHETSKGYSYEVDSENEYVQNIIRMRTVLNDLSTIVGLHLNTKGVTVYYTLMQVYPGLQYNLRELLNMSDYSESYFEKLLLHVSNQPEMLSVLKFNMHYPLRVYSKEESRILDKYADDNNLTQVISYYEQCCEFALNLYVSFKNWRFAANALNLKIANICYPSLNFSDDDFKYMTTNIFSIDNAIEKMIKYQALGHDREPIQKYLETNCKNDVYYPTLLGYLSKQTDESSILKTADVMQSIADKISGDFSG